MEPITMIQELSNAFGVSGFEDEVLEVARRYAKAYTSHMEEDSMRNLYLHYAGNQPQRPVLMLDAHSDETGFMIKAVRPNGTLEFLPLGGWVASTVPAHKVKIKNRDGELISGVVASKPPHYMSAAEQAQSLTMDQMVIDVGACSAEEVKAMGIGVGAPVVPDVQMEYCEQNGVLLGKAFDCRIGCAVLLEVLHRLNRSSLAVNVVGTLSSQEEIGERGVKTAVERVQPDIAIVLEGAPADDTFEPGYRVQTALHQGPMVRHMDRSMITNPRFIRFVLDEAEKLQIPVQEAVRSGGGTNGAMIHVAAGGVPTVVISVPVRYTHSHHCFTALDDFERTVQLVTHIIEALTPEQIRRF